jgi:endoglucanase
LWASVELYRVTGNPEYHDFFLNNYGRRGGFQHTVSWQEVQNFAYDSYLHIHEAAPKQAVRAELLSQLERYCQGLLERIHASGYRYVLQPDEYYWGSNSIAMGYAFDLIQGYELTQRAGYLEAALDQLHYMLGRNPFDLALVTGVGPKPVRHPYHQFSMLLGAGEPVPGMVVGGANKSSKLRGKTLSDFPARCYEDNEKNYFVNETAINYTAPFVFVAGYFSQALKAQHDTVTTDGNR